MALSLHGAGFANLTVFSVHCHNNRADLEVGVARRWGVNPHLL